MAKRDQSEVTRRRYAQHGQRLKDSREGFAYIQTLSRFAGLDLRANNLGMLEFLLAGVVVSQYYPGKGKVGLRKNGLKGPFDPPVRCASLMAAWRRTRHYLRQRGLLCD